MIFSAMEEVDRASPVIANLTEAKSRNHFRIIVVIDGGRGRIMAAALKAFVAIDVTPPPMIGLAKKMETIIFPTNARPLISRSTIPR